jgi:hypothetical protein
VASIVNHARVQSSTAESVEELAQRSGIRAEHVLLEGEEILDTLGERPRKVRARFGLANRLRGTETSFVLFDDGYLNVRHERAGEVEYEHSIDLGYLDPRPERARRVARTTLGVAASLTAGCGLAGLLAYFSVAPAITVTAAITSAAAMSIAWWIFLKRTGERIAFRTRHGRARVLTIFGNAGCYRACRALSRKLTKAIEQAHRRNAWDTARWLRAEVREHYRLLSGGVISQDACTLAITKTLSLFDGA